MRTPLLVVSAVLMLCASHAGAQSKDDYPLTGTAPGAVSTVRVQAPPPGFRVQASETDAVSGGYKMSNGWRLHVDPSDDGIVARIDRQHPMRLIALTPNDYVTRDGNVAMTFNLGKDGDQMLMSYVPSSRGTGVAGMVVLGASVVAR